MQRMKLVGLAAVAVLALAAFASAPALALRNPHWTYNGSELTGSVAVHAEASGSHATQTLKAPGVVINCSKVAVKSGGVLENVSGWGLDKETLVYGGCSVEGHSECDVRNKGGSETDTITTDPLKSKLGYLKKASAEKTEIAEGTTGTIFEPESGSNFVEIEMKGSCPAISEATVTGSVVVKNLGSITEGESHEIEAPETPISKFYVINGGKVETLSPALKVFGFFTSEYIGTSKITTEAGKDWGIA